MCIRKLILLSSNSASVIATASGYESVDGVMH